MCDALSVGYTCVDVQSWTDCKAVNGRPRTKDKLLHVAFDGDMSEQTLIGFVRIMQDGATLNGFDAETLMDFWLLADGLKNTDLCDALEVKLQCMIR